MTARYDVSFVVLPVNGNPIRMFRRELVEREGISSVAFDSELTKVAEL